MIRGRRSNLLLAPGRNRRLLLCTDLKDMVVATRAKAKVNHLGVEDTSWLLASQGREHVSIVTSLDTLDGISLKDMDLRVIRYHGPNHQWDMHRRSLFLLTLAWTRGTGINPRVLNKHLLFSRRATWARAWIGVEVRTSRPRLQGPRGVSTP